MLEDKKALKAKQARQRQPWQQHSENVVFFWARLDSMQAKVVWKSTKCNLSTSGSDSEGWRRSPRKHPPTQCPLVPSVPWHSTSHGVHQGHPSSCTSTVVFERDTEVAETSCDGADFRVSESSEQSTKGNSPASTMPRGVGSGNGASKFDINLYHSVKLFLSEATFWSISHWNYFSEEKDMKCHTLLHARHESGLHFLC